MSNPWVQHVKAFAKTNKLSYGCAMTNPNVRDGYTPVAKSRKQKAEPVKAPVKAPAKPKKKLVVIEPTPKPKPAPKSKPRPIPEFDPTKDDMKQFIKKNVNFDMEKLKKIKFPENTLKKK